MLGYRVLTEWDQSPRTRISPGGIALRRSVYVGERLVTKKGVADVRGAGKRMGCIRGGREDTEQKLTG